MVQILCTLMPISFLGQVVHKCFSVAFGCKMYAPIPTRAQQHSILFSLNIVFAYIHGNELKV